MRVASGADPWPPDKEFCIGGVSKRVGKWEVSASRGVNMFVIIYYLLIVSCSNDHCVICDTSHSILLFPSHQHDSGTITLPEAPFLPSPRSHCCKNVFENDSSA